MLTLGKEPDSVERLISTWGGGGVQAYRTTGMRRAPGAAGRVVDPTQEMLFHVVMLDFTAS
jgi:hypothetical protein